MSARAVSLALVYHGVQWRRNLKTCSKCRQVKELSEFFKNKAAKDGLHNQCRVCAGEANRRSYAKHKETLTAKQRAKYAADPEKHRNANRQWRAANLEKARASSNKWRAANPEFHRALTAAWVAKNKDRVREKAKIWTENNRASTYARTCRWRERNPEKALSFNAARRAALLLRVPGWLTREDFRTMEAFYEEAVRKSAETGIPHQVDHIFPLQGELISGLHVPANLQVLTAEENLRKSNKWVPE